MWEYDYEIEMWMHHHRWMRQGDGTYAFCTLNRQIIAHHRGPGSEWRRRKKADFWRKCARCSSITSASEVWCSRSDCEAGLSQCQLSVLCAEHGMYSNSVLFDVIEIVYANFNQKFYVWIIPAFFPGRRPRSAVFVAAFANILQLAHFHEIHFAWKCVINHFLCE